VVSRKFETADKAAMAVKAATVPIAKNREPIPSPKKPDPRAGSDYQFAGKFDMNVKYNRDFNPSNRTG
jgi:hypothetical protein